MKPIAKRIKEAREAKRWSGTDLAKHAGIRQSFIGALESGAQGHCAENNQNPVDL